MEDLRLIIDLVLALGAAFAGGMIAQRLGQPVLIGYIVAGILIGPNTPGVSAHHDNVEILANLGVAFLMFAIGVELSFAELAKVRRIAIFTGGVQIPLTLAIGAAAGLMLGWSWQAAVLLGAGFALSSTIVAIKLSASRGEGESPQARTALGIGIVQDLSLVPMIALLPVLTGDSDNVVLAVLRSLAIAAAILAVVLLLGTRLVPRILYIVARTGSRELFLLAAVLIALGTAIASQQFGISLAVGAFLAGLVISESEFDAQVLDEIIPLRDLFSTLFFVSVGMLLDPRFMLDHIGIVLLLLVVLIVGKTLVMGGALLATGVNHRTATLAALLLSQMGEFSFVIAGVGMAEGIINRDQYGLILGVALGSILLTPVMLQASPALIGLSGLLPGVRWREVLETGDPIDDDTPHDVVLCGYGRVGAVLGDVLDQNDVTYAVIEINPVTVRELRARGITAHYGDAGSEALLHRAGVEGARVLVVTITDLVAARAAIRQARLMNPTISIVTRAVTHGEVAIHREAGADEIIQPELEAGLEFVQHVMRRVGMTPTETRVLVAMQRAVLYTASEIEPVWDDWTELP